MAPRGRSPPSLDRQSAPVTPPTGTPKSRAGGERQPCARLRRVEPWFGITASRHAASPLRSPPIGPLPVDRHPSVRQGPQAHCGPSSASPMLGLATLVTAALIPRAMAGQLGRFRLPGRSVRRGAKRRSPVRGATVVCRKGRRAGKATRAAAISAGRGSVRSVPARCELGWVMRAKIRKPRATSAI
jgi:hypothetical protein